MLKVGYDVTLLGRGRFFIRGRTGLYRVATELLRALRTRPEVELRFYASQQRGEAAETLEGFDFDSTRLQRHPIERILYPLARALCIPQALDETHSLTGGRRKAFRTVVQALDALPGAQPQLHAQDVFHSPYDPLLSSGIIPAKKPGFATVLTVHDVLPLTHPQFFKGDDIPLRQVIRELEQGAFAHCVSNATMSALIDIAPHIKDRAAVAPLAASKTRFFVPSSKRIEALRADLRIGDAPYLLSLGTLEPRKNTAWALEVFQALASTHPELLLLVTGPPARTGEPWDKILERYPSIRHRCHFTGFVAEDQLAVLYGGALAFLFPSLAEGFGLPVLESMQCGTPVVANATTSLPEVVEDGGVIVDPNDLDAWCSAVHSILSDSTYRGALKENALRRSQAFDWSRTALEVEGIYRAAVRAGSS